MKARIARTEKLVENILLIQCDSCVITTIAGSISKQDWRKGQTNKSNDFEPACVRQTQDTNCEEHEEKWLAICVLIDVLNWSNSFDGGKEDEKPATDRFNIFILKYLSDMGLWTQVQGLQNSVFPPDWYYTGLWFTTQDNISLLQISSICAFRKLPKRKQPHYLITKVYFTCLQRKCVLIIMFHIRNWK